MRDITSFAKTCAQWLEDKVAAKVLAAVLAQTPSSSSLGKRATKRLIRAPLLE